MLEQDKIVPFPILPLGRKPYGGIESANPNESMDQAKGSHPVFGPSTRPSWQAGTGKHGLKERLNSYRPMLSLEDVLTWDEKFLALMDSNQQKKQEQQEKINYYLKEVERLLKF